MLGSILIYCILLWLRTWLYSAPIPCMLAFVIAHSFNVIISLKSMKWAFWWGADLSFIAHLLTELQYFLAELSIQHFWCGSLSQGKAPVVIMFQAGTRITLCVCAAVSVCGVLYSWAMLSENQTYKTNTKQRSRQAFKCLCSRFAQQVQLIVEQPAGNSKHFKCGK